MRISLFRARSSLPGRTAAAQLVPSKATIPLNSRELGYSLISAFNNPLGRWSTQLTLLYPPLSPYPSRVTTNLSSKSFRCVSRTMATTAEPTKEEAVSLFEAVEKKFPHKTVGEDTWYLVVVRWQISPP